MDGAEIKSLLNERAEDLCRYLLPNGVKSGNYWQVGNISGSTGDSLRVNLSGEYVGVWVDRAEPDKKGDLIALWMQVRGTTNYGRCLVQAKEWLGLPIEDEEDRVFRSPTRNQGHYDAPSKCYAALNIDGPVYRYLTSERCISARVLQQYRVCQNSTIAAMGFPHFDGEKLRAIKFKDVVSRVGGERGQWADPKGAHLGLWGKNAVNPGDREIVITEGEIDCLSVAEIGYTAVSMPNGASDQGWIERDWKWLQDFDSIIICYDNDASGESALAKAFPALIHRLGRHRCRVAKLPDGIKDANGALQDGRGNELAECLHAAASVDPASLVPMSKYRADVREILFGESEQTKGIALPWCNKLRFRPQEVTLWTGFSGHGKTTLLLQCLLILTRKHAQRAIVACLEAPAKKTGVILCRQCSGREIGKIEDFEKIYSAVEENLWIYNHVGSTSWRELLDTFRYAYRRYGVQQFVIDSLMTCDIDTDDYNQQSQFMNAIAGFADETGGHVHVVAHSKKREDETRAPGKMDVAGHANITNRAFNGITVHRNMAKLAALKAKEDNARNLHDAELVCWKQRETGELFHIRLWMHGASLQFWESLNSLPRSYHSGQFEQTIYPEARAMTADERFPGERD